VGARNSSFLRGSVGDDDGLVPRALLAALLFSTLPVLGGCVAMGWRFGPGFSVRDRALFAEPPVIERRGGAYVLAWMQGSHPFFFEPGHEIIDGRMIFALVATASSGSLAGRRRELPLLDTDPAGSSTGTCR
jgi:hypothetical protein